MYFFATSISGSPFYQGRIFDLQFSEFSTIDRPAAKLKPLMLINFETIWLHL